MNSKEPLARIPAYIELLQGYYRRNCKKCNDNKKIIHFHEHLINSDIPGNYSIWRDGIRHLQASYLTSKDDGISMLTNMMNGLRFDMMGEEEIEGN